MTTAETPNLEPEGEGFQQQPASNASTIEALQSELSRLKSTLDGQRGYSAGIKKRADALAAQNQELAERLAAMETELATTKASLSSQLSEREKAIKEAEARIARLSLDAVISKLVLSEYPSLAPFYSKGLLAPQSNDEEAIRQYLAEFEAATKSMASVSVLGTTPQPPSPAGKPAPMTILEAQRHLNDTLREYGARSPQYQAAFKAYQEAILNSPSQ